MKKLWIYKEKDEFLLERTNGFNHATKRIFTTEDGLLEYLDIFVQNHDIDEYELDIPPEIMKIVAVKLVPDQAYFWTDEWQKGELEAEEDIKNGHLKTYDNVDDFIADLMGNESKE